MESVNCGVETNHCLECGELLNGRSDKKFCGDYCRNAYNNRLHREEHKIMAGVNRMLANNYRLLHALPEAAVRVGELEKRGFVKDIFTGCRSYGLYRIYECYNIRYKIFFGYLVKKLF